MERPARREGMGSTEANPEYNGPRTGDVQSETTGRRANQKPPRQPTKALRLRQRPGHTSDVRTPHYYAARDPWYTQLHSNIPCLEAVCGNRMAAHRIVPVMSATSAPGDPAPAEGAPCYGARHRPVTLDTPDVALRGQRLMAYGERLRWDEAEIASTDPGCARHPARPRRPMAGHILPEAADRRPPMPPMADGGDDVRAVR